MDKFVVTYAPFARSSNDINKLYIHAATALLLPMVFGCIFFGFSSILVVLTAVLVSYFSECLFNIFEIKKFKVTNLSFLVSGLILGLTLPVKMPLYIVAISAFIAVFIVKMVFGGLGKNIFNPALIGRLIAGIIASSLTTDLYGFTLNGESYVSFTMGGENSIMNLLTGKAVGGIGTTCVLAIVIAYVFLDYMSVIDWKIPIISAVSYFVAALALNGVESAILNICSGSFLFVAVFMVSEPSTSPDTFLGKLLYSAAFGVLSAVLWNISKMGEETVFVAALIVNVFVPFMNKYLVIKQKPLGGIRYAH